MKNVIGKLNIDWNDRVTELKPGYDKLGRPNKDVYFMNLCVAISKRSIDPNSKHGCVFVDQDGGILSTGYNGPVRKSVDRQVPLTAPDKYFFLEHSERNGIYQAARNGISLNNSIVYVTGFPCIDCLRGIIQIGAKKIIYGPLQSVMIAGPDYLARVDRILYCQKIKIERFAFDDVLFEMNPGLKEICDSRKQIHCEWQ